MFDKDEKPLIEQIKELGLIIKKMNITFSDLLNELPELDKSITISEHDTYSLNSNKINI